MPAAGDGGPFWACEPRGVAMPRGAMVPPAQPLSLCSVCTSAHVRRYGGGATFTSSSC